MLMITSPALQCDLDDVMPALVLVPEHAASPRPAAALDHLSKGRKLTALEGQVCIQVP